VGVSVDGSASALPSMAAAASSPASAPILIMCISPC
jgi:hypothetical protein